MPADPAYILQCAFTYTQEARMRQIIREEIAAMLRQRTTTTGGGTVDYREYLATRDEPPAVPPMRVVNTTERL